MVSASENNLGTNAAISSIKPEIVNIIRSEINPELNPAEIETVLEALKPATQSNPLQGTPVNLLYLQDGNNLAAVVIEEDITGKLYTLTAECDLLENSDTIKIENLKDFQFRFQDVFNHNSQVSIYYENDRIDSFVVMKPEQQQLDPRITPVTLRSGTKRSPCHLPPRRC